PRAPGGGLAAFAAQRWALEATGQLEALYGDPAAAAALAASQEQLTAAEQAVVDANAAVLAADAATLDARRAALDTARAELDAARMAAALGGFAPVAQALLGLPIADGASVFPVGGGPAAVSASPVHDGAPRGELAAPAGSPVYALAAATVDAASPAPPGACGIGTTLRTADGTRWTYCHLAELEPAVQQGAHLSAGDLVGLVGATGRAPAP